MKPDSFYTIGAIGLFYIWPGEQSVCEWVTANLMLEGKLVMDLHPGLASHPGVSKITPSCITLQKPG